MYVGIGNAFLYLGIPRFTKDKSIITPKEKSWGCRPKTLACQAHNPLASGPAAIASLFIYLLLIYIRFRPGDHRRGAEEQRRDSVVDTKNGIGQFLFLLLGGDAALCIWDWSCVRHPSAHTKKISLHSRITKRTKRLLKRRRRRWNTK